MQSSKASCILHIFLASLLIVLLLHSYASAATWNVFQNRHIAPRARINENLNAYCARMMTARRMTRHQCKHHNTFIHALSYHVQQVCRGQSTHWMSNLFNSTQHFDFTDCQFTGGRPPYNCKYQGTADTRRIVLACSKSPFNSNPIHFERIIP